MLRMAIQASCQEEFLSLLWMASYTRKLSTRISVIAVDKVYIGYIQDCYTSKLSTRIYVIAVDKEAASNPVMITCLLEVAMCFSKSTAYPENPDQDVILGLACTNNTVCF
jgi:hypothetical protein